MGADASVPVAVVGAGPYGLSLAAYLGALGVRYRIFGVPMESWVANMPRGMFLKSEGFASNLADPGRRWTLARYCREHDLDYADHVLPIPLDTYVGYGGWFQRRLVPEVEQTRVTALRRAGGSFELELATGECLPARRVVVACGTTPFAAVPPELRGLPPERVSHSSAHLGFAEFSGRDVTVIGGGQSALETAALLSEAGATTRLLVRKDVVDWNPDPVPGRGPVARLREPVAGLGSGWACWLYSNAPAAFRRLPPTARVRRVRKAMGPAGAWWLRERVMGRVPIDTGCSVVAAGPENGGARLWVARRDDGPTEMLTEHVIAATGFPIDVTRLPFIGPGLLVRLRRCGGAPVLSRNLESSVPGLHFMGLAAAASFGPVCRFVYGARFSAERIARHLAAERASPRGSPWPSSPRP